MSAVQIRDDEHAEIELRILVALYDAWPNRLDVRPGEVYRPGGRYTTPNDAPPVMRQLLAGRVDGHLGDIGLVNGKLTATMRARLDDTDARGAPWIARARAVIIEGCEPVTGHASEVREGLRG
ncbi:hypothetical protein D3273_24590 [Lichenibacterium minor]|uniref:Uncharacterized protein n=1 Tax=Lichenibacterium minor TaxID=2316528 RepID=A0A4Q2TYV3_9HYPH|nr:hypothetical protein [Lichenibacterium minor]RYC29292.1 hypothetical protein D3273_24590 [Lichenibacterium minor]